MVVIRVDTSAVRAVPALAERLRDLRPVLREIGEIVRASVLRNFEVGGRPRRWKRSRRAERQAGQTLVDSGRLRQSIATARPRITDRSLTIGTNVKYAAVHQFGARKGSFGARLVRVRSHTRRSRRGVVYVKAHRRYQILPWGDIPARPFMVLQKADVDDIREAVLAYLMGA